jgi:hypothetical protein
MPKVSRSTKGLLAGLTAGILAGCFLGCVGQSQVVRPDDMSAEAHRKEAARLAAAAEAERARSDSPALQPHLGVSPSSNPEGYYYPTDLYDPRKDALLRAQQLSRHARQHEAAASRLEAFEQGECRQFPPATRAACPLLSPVQEVSDVEGGVRVHFKPGARVDALFAHMQCHLAYARARGFDDAAGCPLYVPGVAIRRTDDPLALEIVGSNARTASEIRNNSRAEAVVVHDRSN